MKDIWPVKLLRRLSPTVLPMRNGLLTQDRLKTVVKSGDDLYFILFFAVLQLCGWRGSNCVMMPNFVAIGHTLYHDFSIFKMAAVRHIGFLKFYLPSGSEGQSKLSCQISWRLVQQLPRYGDLTYQLFQYDGLPPSWLCYARALVIHEKYLKCIWWYLSLCKIWLKSM